MNKKLGLGFLCCAIPLLIHISREGTPQNPVEWLRPFALPLAIFIAYGALRLAVRRKS